MMADNPRGYRRDVRGRFVRPVQDVDAESSFGPKGESIEDIDNVSGAPSPSTIDRPRHTPEGDGLAGRPYPGPLRPRTARLIDACDDATGAHAIPDRATLHADAMREAAGTHAGDLDPVRYLVGNIDGIEE